MGEIADMMLDGTLCECCGEFLGGAGDGYPVRCASCAAESGVQDLVFGQVRVPKRKPKQACPECGRKVVGLADHRRDAHGVRS